MAKSLNIRYTGDDPKSFRQLLETLNKQQDQIALLQQQIKNLTKKVNRK